MIEKRLTAIIILAFQLISSLCLSLNLNAQETMSTISDCGSGKYGGGSTIPSEFVIPDASHLMISGPNVITAVPSNPQYSASGGFNDGYDWSASGVNINDSGVAEVTSNSPCSFTVTVTDAGGRQASMGVRIASKGHWVEYERENCCNAPDGSLPGCEIYPIDPCNCRAMNLPDYATIPEEVEDAGTERIRTIYGCIVCCYPSTFDICMNSCNLSQVFKCGTPQLRDSGWTCGASEFHLEGISTIIRERWTCN